MAAHRVGIKKARGKQEAQHESRRIVVRQVESNLPMLVSAFEAPPLVESQAALQADYPGAPREGSLSSVSSSPVVPDSEVDPHRRAGRYVVLGILHFGLELDRAA